MSGSIGGLTASRNRGGAYFRRRSVPTNPNSNHQQASRSALGSLVQAWNTLTPEQKQGWKDYALNTPRTDVLGQALTLTGQQAYIGSNSAKLMAAALGLTAASPGLLTRVDDAPIIFNTGAPIVQLNPVIVNLLGTTVASDMSLASETDDDGVIFFFIGRPVSNGVNYYKAPFALAHVESIATASSVGTLNATFATATSWAWPSTSDPIAIVAGNRYPIRIVIAYNDGRYSQPFLTFFTAEEEEE